MADKQTSNCGSPEKRPVLMSSGSSSTEPTTSASSDLQPFSLGRASTSAMSPSNLSSYTVPVRLDVLYFLLNSAAKGAQNAQNALPSVPTQAGQGPFSAYPYPATQHVVSSCSCCHHSQCGGAPAYANVPHPVAGGNCLGATQGSFGNQGALSAGALGNQNSGQHGISATHQWESSGKGGPGYSQHQPGNTWRSSGSTSGWMENQRQEGTGQGNRDSWQGKWPSKGRSWGDRRQGSSEAGSWNAGSKGWGREGSPYGSNTGVGRRNQEWSSRKMPRDVPEAKRRPDDARVEWPKSHGKPEPTSSASKAVYANPAKPSLIQAGGEDWDLDYKSKKASSAAHSSTSQPAPQKNQSAAPKLNEDWETEYAPSSNPPKLKAGTTFFLGSPSKDPKSSIPKKKSAGSRVDQSKNGGFVSYLKSLSSSGKSSSEGSTEHAPSSDPPKLKGSTTLLLESPSKDAESSTPKMESADSRADQSKNGGFASYLKSLSSDFPGKSSSEGSTEYAPSFDPPKLKGSTSLLESPSKDPESSTPKMESTDYRADPSKNGGFASYFKGLFSDYRGKSSSGGSTEYAPSSDPPKLKASTTLLLESPSKDPESSTPKMENADSHADQSKNGGFASYLKGLSSDFPGKSSSEGSTDLIIETDMELSKTSDEEQSPKNVHGEQSKASE